MLWFKKKKSDVNLKPIEWNKDEVAYNTDENAENINGNFLLFDNLNFKLAVIQVLMYDLELLKPAFNIFDFAEEYGGEAIDSDSDEIIQPALEFFKGIQIPTSLASHVETIYMDGGNEVYMNIIPEWDGEDDFFDLNEVTLAELKQFPNLKQATIMSGNYKRVEEVFHSAGIEVEQL